MHRRGGRLHHSASGRSCGCGKRVDSLKAAARAKGYDAVFVGTGAPRGRDLDISRARRRPRPTSTSASTGSPASRSATSSRIGRRVIVLGGGNTAMDCCRTSRRLGGEDVKVVVRSGFEEMKASPWEKEDAMHEGIPILNYLVPKEFTHEDGRLTGVRVREGRSRSRRREGRRRARADRRARRALPMRRRAGRGRPGERLSLDRARHRPRVRPVGHAGGGRGDHAVDPPEASSSAATRRSGPKNIIWAVAHGHEAAISIDRICQRRGRAPSARRRA